MSTQDFTNDERFDGLYMNVANTARGIEPLLDTVFSFLRRKTDFFNGPDGQNTDMAVAKVNEVLQKHVQIHKLQQRKKKDESQRKKEKEDERKRKMKCEKEEKEAAAAAAESDDGVIEIGDDGFDISSLSDKAKNATKHGMDVSKESTLPQDKNIAVESHDNDNKDSGDDDEDSGPPPKGNGGTVPGKYVWTQTLGELNISISLPDNTRGRDLSVTIKKKQLSVAIKSQLPIHIVDSPLSKMITCDDSFWTVEDGNKLIITLEKKNQMEWWDCVCDGDPKIDVKKVQPENSKLDDLDGDTRQTVEKMMFDQRQKSMGLPSSDEQRKMEMLEKFKTAHPEMDFSNAKIS